MDESPTTGQLQREIEQLHSRIVDLESDNAALREETRQSSQSFEEMFTIFESLDEPVYVADPDTHDILYINQAAKNLWGGSVGQKCHSYVQGRDEPCPFCTNTKILGEDPSKPYVWESRNERTGRWFRCVDKAIRWPDGRMVHFELAVDITDRKKIEKSLERTRQRLELVIEATQLGTLDWDLTTGEITANEQMAKILGYSMDELRPLLPVWETQVHEDDLPVLREALAAHFRGDTPVFEMEYRVRDSSGQWHWLLVLGSVIQRDEQGTPLRAVGTVVNSHQRRVMQEELFESERRYREYLEKIEGIAMRLDLNLEYVFMHGAVEAITGYTADDFTSGKIQYPDILAPEDEKRVMQAMTRFINLEDESRETEYRIIRKDGEIRWIHDSFKLARDREGNVVGYEGVVFDVTERKQMEDSLREVKQRLEMVIEAAELGTIDWDVQAGRVTPNRKGAEMLGYSYDEYVPRAQEWETLIHKDDFPAMRAAIDAHFRGETPDLELEYRARTKGGQWRWRLLRGKLVERDAQGNPLRAMGTVLDVHDRKIAEEQLRLNDQRYREYLERLEGIAYWATLDQRFIFIRGAIEHITGYTEEEFMSGEILWPDLLMPKDAPRIQRSFSVFRGVDDDSIELEYRIRRKDGAVRWVHDNLRMVRDPNSESTFYQGVVYDVTQQKEIEEALRQAHDKLEQRVAERTAELANTNLMLLDEIAERHQAEQALRQSEETARALINAATEGAILVELDGTIVTLNETGAERLGGSVEELIGKNAVELTAPELVDSRVAYGKQVIQTGKPVRFQDGHDGRFADNNIYPVFDDDGKVVRLAVFTRDITDVKLADDRIRAEQRILRRLLNAQERERQLVAYEIHDGLAQELTGAIFRLQGFRGLVDKDPEEAWKTFDVGINLLSDGVKEARSLITGLRPPVLDELGIVAAIEYLVCESHQRGGPHIDFQLDLQVDHLVPPLQTAVFRIVQESLTNARRHSESKLVKLEVRERDDLIHIDVQDWGIGFDPEQVQQQRFGLQGIRERVRLLGGRLSLDTRPGQGTKIHAELPIIEQSDELFGEFHA